MERGQLFVVGSIAVRVLDPGLLLVKLPRLKLQLYHGDYARILGAIDRSPPTRGRCPYHRATLPALGDAIVIQRSEGDITMLSSPVIRTHRSS